VFKENFLDPDVGKIDGEAEEKYEVRNEAVHLFGWLLSSYYSYFWYYFIWGQQPHSTTSHLWVFMQEELYRNPARKARKESFYTKLERDSEAFDAWTCVKESIDTARACLNLLPCTIEAEPTSGLLSFEKNTQGPRPGQARTLDRMPTEDEEKLWEAVGYACKQIDRALVGTTHITSWNSPLMLICENCVAGDWIAWAAPLFAADECMKLWLDFDKSGGGAGANGATSSSEAGRPTSARTSRSLSTSEGGRGRQERKSASRSRSPGARSRGSSMEPQKARAASVKLLKKLTEEFQELAELRKCASDETVPPVPAFQRVSTAEILPTFVHGHEGAISLIATELNSKAGGPLEVLGSTGVGAELVLRWWIGDADGDDDGFTTVSGKPGRNTKASNARQQPPYAVVLETCGLSGGKEQREGTWRRVLVDPPQPVPALSSAPATDYISTSISEQGLGGLPPEATPGYNWFINCNPDMTRMRGCIRLTGLLPNTAYCYRLRAYNRVGPSQYAFGVFTTAAAPPPSPIIGTLAMVPLHLLNPADAAEARNSLHLPACSPNSVRMCWDRKIGRRAGLIRLFRVINEAVRLTREIAEQKGAAKRDGKPTLQLTDPNAAEKTVLLRCIHKENGLLQFLAAALATPAFWPLRSGKAADPDEPVDIAMKTPCSVYEAIRGDLRESLSAVDVLEMFSADAASLGADVESAVQADTQLLGPSPDKSPQATTAAGGLEEGSLAGAGVGMRTSLSKIKGEESGASTPRAAASPAEVGARNCLLQCVSDGQGGQQWQEVFVGMRSLRTIMKLLPGTAYCFRAQIINSDGIVSHMGAPFYISTGLQTPTDIRVIRRKTPTTAAFSWPPISGANQLAIARAAGAKEDEDGQESVPSSRPRTARRSSVSTQVAAPGDVDAVLNNLATKSKAESSSLAAVAQAEGDGGVGVDLARAWSRYDSDGKGILDHAEFRGLLADLGAISESEFAAAAAYTLRGEDQTANAKKSVAAMRYIAALSALDGAHNGFIKFNNFAEWWNGIDATRVAAKARVGAASVTRPSSTLRSRSSTSAAAGLTSPGAFPVEDNMQPYEANGITIDHESAKSATVLYVVERRFKVEYGGHVWSPWEIFSLSATPTINFQDLVPNTEYSLRVTALGRHAESIASKPVVFATPPLAPFAPVVIRSTPRMLTMRWYSGEMSCSKYELQYKVVETLQSVAAGASMVADTPDAGQVASASARDAIYRGRNIGELRARALITQMGNPHVDETELWAEDDATSDKWRTCYHGPFSYTAVAGMAANCIYRLRVRGMNIHKEASLPSVEAQAITMDSSKPNVLTPFNASKYFVVEVQKIDLIPIFPPENPPPGEESSVSAQLYVPDCVIGDTICFTEDVFVDGSAVRNHRSEALNLTEVPFNHKRAKYLCARTIAATVIGDTSSRMQAQDVIKMDGRDFGESLHQAAQNRIITIQVDWCTLGGYPSDVYTSEVEAACKVKDGAIVKRNSGALCSIDIFRVPWEDEPGRWSLVEELAASFDMVPQLPSTARA
jgi:hypothetical protein